jgi:hypothetical protein
MSGETSSGQWQVPRAWVNQKPEVLQERANTTGFSCLSEEGGWAEALMEICLEGRVAEMRKASNDRWPTQASQTAGIHPEGNNGSLEGLMAQSYRASKVEFWMQDAGKICSTRGQAVSKATGQRARGQSGEVCKETGYFNHGKFPAWTSAGTKTMDRVSLRLKTWSWLKMWVTEEVSGSTPRKQTDRVQVSRTKVWCVSEPAKLLKSPALVVWGSWCAALLVSFFRDRVSLCNPGCPGIPSVDQAGLELSKIYLLTLTNSLTSKIHTYTPNSKIHTRRGSQISLHMVVSHHVVAGIWTLDLQKSSRVLLPTEPSHQPPNEVLYELRGENSVTLVQSYWSAKTCCPCERIGGREEAHR